MNLSKNTKDIVLHTYTTGCTTTASSILDLGLHNCEGVMLRHVTANTTSSVSFTLQVSASTATASFANASFNSSTVTLASTQTASVMKIDVVKPTYRYLRTVVNSTGIANVGMVIATPYGLRVGPTTNASTHVAGELTVVSPTT
jgi:hypothetical protein